MGLILRAEKIGALTESGGTLTLAPSRITIGGQQFSTDQLQVALPTLTANTRYQVFAVQSNGAVSLEVSTADPTAGPAGFLVWRWVGSFYTNFDNSFIKLSDLNAEANQFTNPQGSVIDRSEKVTAHTYISSSFGGTGTLPLDTVRDDTHGLLDSGNFQLVFPVPGEYWVSFSWKWDPSGSGERVTGQINGQGNQLDWATGKTFDSFGDLGMSRSGFLPISVGGTIDVDVTINNTALNPGEDDTYLSVQKIK